MNNKNTEHCHCISADVCGDGWRPTTLRQQNKSQVTQRVWYVSKNIVYLDFLQQSSRSSIYLFIYCVW